MIAHAGGVDEIILGVGVVVLYLLLRSTRAEREAEPTEGPCLYCGTHLGPERARCPDCGFRARRGAATPSPSDAAR